MTHTKQTWDLKCWSPLLIWKFLNITLIYSAFPLGTFHTLHVVCLSLNKHYSESACVRSLQALDIQRLRRRSCCPKETHNQWRERERETQESFLGRREGSWERPEEVTVGPASGRWWWQWWQGGASYQGLLPGGGDPRVETWPDRRKFQAEGAAWVNAQKSHGMSGEWETIS